MAVRIIHRQCDRAVGECLVQLLAGSASKGRVAGIPRGVEVNDEYFGHEPIIHNPFTAVGCFYARPPTNNPLITTALSARKRLQPRVSQSGRQLQDLAVN